MGRRVTYEWFDDLDGPGNPAHETVRFSLDEERFEIDLSDFHARALRALLAPYIADATVVGKDTDTVARRAVIRDRPTVTRGAARRAERETVAEVPKQRRSRQSVPRQSENQTQRQAQSAARPGRIPTVLFSAPDP